MSKLREIASSPNDPRKPAAEWELSICYFSGFGAPRNFDASLQWLSLARDHGIVAAQDYFNPLNEAITAAKEATVTDKATNADKISAEKVHDRNPSNSTESTKDTGKESNGKSEMETTKGAAEERTSSKLPQPGHLKPELSAWQEEVGAASGSEKKKVPRQYTSPALLAWLRGRGNEPTAQAEPAALPDQLKKAILSESLGDILQWIDREPSCIDSRDDDGNTPLLLAASRQRFTVVRYLASLPNVDASTFNKSGQTALHMLVDFEDADVESLVFALVKLGADLGHEALPAPREGGRFLFTTGMRACPIINAILNDKMKLLRHLVEAGHMEESVSVCRICEAGSRFRRVLAVSLSLFRVDALDLIAGHLKQHSKSEILDLTKLEVLAGQSVLPLYEVPFKSVAVVAMDLPESFVRAMIYGKRYLQVLQRTIDFLFSVQGSIPDDEAEAMSVSTLAAAVMGDSLDAVSFLLDEKTKQWAAKGSPLWWIGRYFELGTSPFACAIESGLREIFDRFLTQSGDFLETSVGCRCFKTNCPCDVQPWYTAVPHALLGQAPSPYKPPGHAHPKLIAPRALRIAARSRHQDCYFL